MLQGTAWFQFPEWTGYGYYAYRQYHPFSGYTEWQIGPWLYYGDAEWWAYVPVFEGWIHPIPGTATFQGGAHVPTEVLWYDYASNAWYSMGSCVTNAPSLGITAVYVGP